jgi:hypothetical protein
MDPRAGRPTADLTGRVLSAGALIAAIVLLVSLLLGFWSTGPAVALATAGVLILLATPPLGLLATALELRRSRPTHAWLALAVIGVMAVSLALSMVLR